jgi:hypothetical protein
MLFCLLFACHWALRLELGLFFDILPSSARVVRTSLVRIRSEVMRLKRTRSKRMRSERTRLEMIFEWGGEEVNDSCLPDVSREP